MSDKKTSSKKARIIGLLIIILLIFVLFWDISVYHNQYSIQNIVKNQFNQNSNNINNQNNNNNVALQSSCFNNADSNGGSTLSFLYDEAKLPNNNAESTILNILQTRVNNEGNCFKNYPVIHSEQQNVSLQKNCINSMDSFYSQFVGLANAQMLDPYQFPDASTYLVDFQNIQSQAEQNCRMAYP